MKWLIVATTLVAACTEHDAARTDAAPTGTEGGRIAVLVLGLAHTVSVDAAINSCE